MIVSIIERIPIIFKLLVLPYYIYIYIFTKTMVQDYNTERLYLKLRQTTEASIKTFNANTNIILRLPTFLWHKILEKVFVYLVHNT